MGFPVFAIFKLFPGFHRRLQNSWTHFICFHGFESTSDVRTADFAQHRQLNNHYFSSWKKKPTPELDWTKSYSESNCRPLSRVKLSPSWFISSTSASITNHNRTQSPTPRTVLWRNPIKPDFISSRHTWFHRELSLFHFSFRRHILLLLVVTITTTMVTHVEPNFPGQLAAAVSR